MVKKAVRYVSYIQVRIVSLLEVFHREVKVLLRIMVNHLEELLYLGRELRRAPTRGVQTLG